MMWDIGMCHNNGLFYITYQITFNEDLLAYYTLSSNFLLVNMACFYQIDSNASIRYIIQMDDSHRK